MLQLNIHVIPADPLLMQGRTRSIDSSLQKIQIQNLVLIADDFLFPHLPLRGFVTEEYLHYSCKVMPNMLHLSKFSFYCLLEIH